MSERPELLDATDEQIDRAVAHADAMALRGLLYQLTGDEEVAATEVTTVMAGFAEMQVPANRAAVELLRSKAATFLKRHRDAGGGPLPIGPPERLARSMSLTVGTTIADADVDLWLEQLAVDPWARGLEWRSPPPPERLQAFSVLVIGAGAGGLGAAVQLRRAGIPFVVVEKNPGVGGTWFENRYPGARVDQPSRLYTHTFGVGFDYPNPYCEQDENERYFNWVADAFDGVRESIRFETEVKSVTWDDGAKRWDVEAVGPDGPVSWSADVVISSVGFLARPNVPAIEGLDSFDGPAFHTARWPSDLDLAGKRVGVVGTGCTGYQMIPELAKLAGHTYVFQRTPNWCFEAKGYLAPFPDEVTWLDRNFPYLVNFTRLRLSWIYGPDGMGKAFTADPDFDDEHARSALNKLVREQRIAFMERKFADRPDLLEKMLPTAPPFSSRPVLVDADYSIYDALHRDDVTLVTDPIRRITPTGIETDGGVHDVDAIVFATGFRANDFLWPMDVRGRDGRSLEDLWQKDGARAYLGTMLPGFPNFFMLYGPNTNATGGLGVFELEEMVIRFALECVAHLIVNGEQTVEVSEEGYWRYNAELDREEARKIYVDPRADNYYRNEHGRSAGNSPFDVRRMWAWLRRPEDRRGVDAGDGDDAVRPHFGQDLLVE